MKPNYRLIERLLREAPLYRTSDLPQYPGQGLSPKPQYGPVADHAIQVLGQAGFDVNDPQQVQQLIAALQDQAGGY